AGSHISQKFHIIQIKKPVGVVDHESLSIGKIDKSLHLFLETVDIMLDRLLRHHLAHIRSAGGVSDHSGSAAQKSDGTVPCHLETFHQAKRHEVAYMKAVRSGIKADIKGGFPLIYHF